MRKLIVIFAWLYALPVLAQYAPQTGPGSSFYASDAFPGFDDVNAELERERKEPKWFSWINGPEEDNAQDQFKYCQELIADGDDDDAMDELDALVREWPTSPEASEAQRRLADLLMLNEKYEDAFEAYRYLLDFYPLQCDYDTVAKKLYDVAGKLREEGKTIVFFRFKNSADVRRKFEGAVLRAPGAKWAPKAMLTIGELREEEDSPIAAVKVYENLRNLHHGTVEARIATMREAVMRMEIFEDYGYNRDRVKDTINFMKMALYEVNEGDRDRISEYLAELEAYAESEAYEAAKFYDSNTRTRRTALGAYERFLRDYPNGVRAKDVRKRIEELKGEIK